MKTRLGAAGAGFSFALCLALAAACSSGSSPANPPAAPDQPGSGGKPGMPTNPGGTGGASGQNQGGTTGGGGAIADAGTGTPGDTGRDMRAGGGGTPGNGGGSGGSGPAPVSDAGSPPAQPAGPWARGVTVGLIEVTQGVFVKIGQGATVVDPAMRNAPLIEGRPLFVRAHLTTGAGFQARRLRAVLTIDYGDGNSKAVEDSKMIAGSSDPERLDSSLNFLLTAADVKPKAAMAVAIYEAGEAAGPDPSPTPRFPATGSADLAIKAGRMVLDVVAMPVVGPGGALEDTPARRKHLENDLYDLYPVQQVNLRFREPMTVTAKITASSAGFTALRNARTMDQAKPWEYYHLIVGRTDTTFSFTGVASGAGATPGDASRRVAITVTSTRVVDGNSNTMGHEIGHNHGRNHAPACGAAGPDNMFPYMAGDMGVNGFSLSTLTLKSRKSFKELMGYCRPRWISDYTWRMLEARVRIVSAFAGAAGGGTPMALLDRSLQAFVGPGERPDFGVVAGRLVGDDVAMTGTRKARLHLGDGRTIEVPVAVQLLSDDETREIALNLPNEEVLSAEVVIDGETYPIDVTGM